MLILVALVGCPFVTRVHGAFQDEKNLYLMLEYCPGGELKFHFPKVNEMNNEFTTIILWYFIIIY